MKGIQSMKKTRILACLFVITMTASPVVISEHITITTENLAKQGVPGQNNDKNIIHLPRQDCENAAKSILYGAK